LKVLLIKDVKNLGKSGEIKEVKDGYGENFLINKGFAKLATPQVVQKWKAERDAIATALEAEISKLKEYKKKLEANEIKIEREQAPVGIKGSVTNTNIADELKSQLDIDIDKKNINLKKSIKSEGVHEVDIKLGHGIHVDLKIKVVGI